MTIVTQVTTRCLGTPRTVRLKADSTLTIFYSEDSGSDWIPPPERFREQLELLLQLERLNAEANSR